MSSTFEEMLRESGDVSEEKRKKVLEKIKIMDGADLRVIYQSLFFDEIMETFDQLPQPKKQLTEKERDGSIFKSLKERGFYTKNSD